MELVQIVGIVFAAVVILVIAYLYRESAIAEGKAEIAIGSVKFNLGGKAQKKAEAAQAPAAPPKIEQSAEGGAILDSPPEIHGAGEIKQKASQDGVISGSGPKIS